MAALAVGPKNAQTYRETGSIRETAQSWHTTREVVRRYPAEGEARPERSIAPVARNRLEDGQAPSAAGDSGSRIPFLRRGRCRQIWSRACRPLPATRFGSHCRRLARGLQSRSG